MTNIQDIDPVEFVEDYLGIELLPYQKEILRKIWRTDKIYIYPWQRNGKCCLLINNDVDKLRLKHVTNGTI